MRFDTIIIGGGLAGLVAGIKLTSEGQKCAIISSGQSALHFFSGSFDLLGYNGTKEIDNPIEAIADLDAKHPYSKMGAATVAALADEAKDFFNKIGIKFCGETTRNHYRISPTGELRKTWLTLDKHFCCNSLENLSIGKTLILNIDGFLDFHPHFLSDGLKRQGIDCCMASVTIDELQRLRTSPTEMRSANIAKVLHKDDTIVRFTEKVAEKAQGFDTVILPSVFGIYDSFMENYLVERLKCNVRLVSTFPPSAPGIRIQMMLKQHFQNLGGVYMLGDMVTNGHLDGDRLMDIHTANHKDIPFEADNFIIATGSFFSHGLQAHLNSICEPIFNLDVTNCGERQQWFDQNVFGSQPYMTFGVVTDNNFHPHIEGRSVENLYAVGSLLESANCLKEASGAGVSILSALNVANNILKR